MPFTEIPKVPPGQSPEPLLPGLANLAESSQWKWMEVAQVAQGTTKVTRHCRN